MWEQQSAPGIAPVPEGPASLQVVWLHWTSSIAKGTKTHHHWNRLVFYVSVRLSHHQAILHTIISGQGTHFTAKQAQRWARALGVIRLTTSFVNNRDVSDLIEMWNGFPKIGDNPLKSWRAFIGWRIFVWIRQLQSPTFAIARVHRCSYQDVIPV